MERAMHEEIQFEKISYADAIYPASDHEDCTFDSCDFSKSDLSGSSFADTLFAGCQFSMTKLCNTTFRNVKFKDCKFLGLHFEDCNHFLFTVSFENCSAKLCSFIKMDLQNTRFSLSAMLETDFSETNLSGAIFDQSDIMGSIFDNTTLEKADFRTAYNYSIDPERNRLKKAKFSLSGVVGLLNKHDIQIDL